MRATNVLALIALAGSAAPATASVLPPPPYAVDAQPAGQTPNRQSPAAASQGYDRYGGGLRRPAMAPSQAAPSQAGYANAPAPQRTLAWAGKTESRPQGPAAPAFAPAFAQAPAMPQTPPVGPWRPLSYQPQPAAPAPAAPRSIYDPAPAPAAPAQPGPPRQAIAQQQTPNGPRFYSLHREYGIEPDAIPIPPQFFGPTADMSAPPADPVVKHVTNAAGQTRTVAVPSDDQGTP